jgi:hypothetical protein
LSINCSTINNFNKYIYILTDDKLCMPYTYFLHRIVSTFALFERNSHIHQLRTYRRLHRR